MERRIYIRLHNRIKVPKRAKIYLKDIVMNVISAQQEAQIDNFLLYEVTEEDKNIIVIDGMNVISKLKNDYKFDDIQLIGPTQTIVEVDYSKAKRNLPLFLIVWFLLFIGSGITIMNFHEDVSMQKVHQKLYYMITGNYEAKPLIFQIPYSFGLGIGMTLFLNHVFKKRINEEPSPLEVEMFNYQQSIDQYIIMNENKEGLNKIDDH